MGFGRSRSAVDDSVDTAYAKHDHCIVAVHTVSPLARVPSTVSYNSPIIRRFSALVVLLRTETWQARRGMIEYNLTFLRQGVRRILMEVEV